MMMKSLIDRNFDLRRAIWGDQALGGEEGPNLRMINVWNNLLHNL